MADKPSKKTTRPTRKPPDHRVLQLQAQLAQVVEALKRERADADNIRRRVAIERERDQQLVRRDTIVSLLPVIDNLHRAFAQPPAELADNQWVAGVLKTEQQLEGVLTDLGLRAIKTIGQVFDPSLMEAVAAVPTSDQPEQMVVAEVVHGYLWGDEVVRIAQVKVAVRPQPGPAPDPPGE